MANPLTAGELRLLYHHIFLPPQLPQTSDDAVEVCKLVLQLSLEALRALQLSHPDEYPAAVANVITTLENLKAVNSLDQGATSESELSRILITLEDGQTTPVLIGHQNAAILCTRRGHHLVFEAFELSPSNTEVMRADGRLIRCFPGTTVAINVLQHAEILPIVAETLSTMCHGAAPDMQPHSFKAGAKHEEHRDTTDPAVVTGLFMGFLRGLGEAIPVSGVCKNTRDDVLWYNALAPWRRSPMWLLIRVTIHLLTRRSTKGSDLAYKRIMLYIMCHAVKLAHDLAFPSDCLYAMGAKIVRRLHKLRASEGHEDSLHDPLLDHVEFVLQRASIMISGRWRKILKKDARALNMKALADLDIEQDTYIDMPDLDNYIRSMQSHPCVDVLKRFLPQEPLDTWGSSTLPCLSGELPPDFSRRTAVLQNVEHWVSHNVDSWLPIGDTHIPNACQKLAKLMVDYHHHATAHYSPNPEGTSVAILTVFELWVACDKVAVHKCPMLAEYPPDMPPEILQSLLLPQSHQMERLSKVEMYLQERQISSKFLLSGLMFSMTDKDSFPARYFADSKVHRDLREAIEKEAQECREAKMTEFSETKGTYERLDAWYNETDCDYRAVVVNNRCNPPETEYTHMESVCKKCLYRKERDSLVIEVHEWPLPEHPVEASVVVFELRVPSWFAAWRDARLFMLHDVLKGRNDSKIPSAKYLLQEDPHLKHEFIVGSSHKNRKLRTRLLSERKPQVNTHYSRKLIANLEVDTLCVKNGLKYNYHDEGSGRYIGNMVFGDTVNHCCTYKLPLPELQRFISRSASLATGDTPNTVISTQDKCPSAMVLEEYKELCSIPLGHHIRWANMLLQLAMPGVDFRKETTSLVFFQCIYQTGPPGEDELRESHAIFCQADKAFGIVKALDSAIERVKRNWESAQALSLFACMTTRVMSLNSETKDACVSLLQKIRRTAVEWMCSLRDLAYNASSHDERTLFLHKGVEAALICAATYDVEERHLPEILSPAQEASTLIQAAIAVHQCATEETWNDSHPKSLRLRFVRLLHRCYNFLAANNEALDHAVKCCWAAFVPGSKGWVTASGQADHWVMTETISSSGSTSLVRIDLLSGELLVNGLPVDQPPPSFRSKPLYATLFGSATVEVMPGTSKGFRFSTKRKVSDHKVQLGMRERTGMLLVQASLGSDVIENIPGEILAPDLPTHFVEDFVHWYNFTSGEVELRPKDDPWNPRSPGSWTLQRTSSKGWRMTKDGSAVVGLQSVTAQLIADLFDPLADTYSIHCILQSADGSLRVDIPTLRLSFFLEKGGTKLRSKEYPSMVVDDKQELGTLIGFKNKLMLASANGDRLLLLPEAKVVYNCKWPHITVSVRDKEDIRKVHAVKVDTLLDRLVDNGDLACKFYLAYLHALTSYCLPDPLTHYTGTEQALVILGSSGARSFEQLSQDCINILASIAGLSPGRYYYPPDKRVMQTVKWNGRLGFLAQHPCLRSAVQEIFDQAKQARLFYPDSDLKFPSLQTVEVQLQDRDSIRSSTFRVPGFGAEDFTSGQDVTYTARDKCWSFEGSINAANITHILFQSQGGLHWPAPTIAQLWGRLREVSVIQGRESEETRKSYRYYGDLLDPSQINRVVSNFLIHLPKLAAHGALKERYSVAIWIASMAFTAKKLDLMLLQMLGMVSRRPQMLKFRPPPAISFPLLEGTMCTELEVLQTVESHTIPFEMCPESQLLQKDDETSDQHAARRLRAWRIARKDAVINFVHALVAQWPCANPSPPALPSCVPYVNFAAAMRSVKAKFLLWNNNKMLHGYFWQLLTSLESLEKHVVQLAKPIDPSAPRRLFSVQNLSLHSLFSTQAPQIRESDSILTLKTIDQDAGSREKPSPLLRSLLQALECRVGISTYEREYTHDLQSSLKALLKQSSHNTVLSRPSFEELASHHRHCLATVNSILERIIAATASVPHVGGELIMQHWPRISPVVILQQLSHDRYDHLPSDWKVYIVHYGLAITALQQATRLLGYYQRSQQIDLTNELENVGHYNWSPAEHPESLLIEIEGNIMIREVQEQIACQMRAPSSGHNVVMQLNMGEGKSTVITPMVASSLADGSRLVRVVVAKPQSKQMAEMLVSKFGGLLNRRLYHMPFSRSLDLDHRSAGTIFEMLRQCQAAGGILLVQPEHLLSMRLMGPECFINGKDGVGQTLMKIQDFFDQHSRDIVDESDENFSVRFELIYTMGTQQAIELSPDRWFLMQQVLELVHHLARPLADELPSSIEVHDRGAGAFPRIRLLRADATRLLTIRAAAHIRDNGLEGFQISRHRRSMREAVYTFMTDLDIDDETSAYVQSGEFWNTSKVPLLLLRGILAGGVLAFVLGQKRWRVNYGLATRSPPTRLAVPYRAKDNPSPRSEFSHPDVVIALTSLCYYYEGLSDDDMFTAFEHLLNSDQANIEYQAWIKCSPGVPQAFRQLHGINLRDRMQCMNQLFPTLCFGKNVVDYFLSHVVFSKEMKQYPHKLSASGWDIGKNKFLPTTGFSGTNDSKRLLPLFVNQLDLEPQKHTNALVLERLLDPVNGVKLMARPGDHVTDAEHLLSTALSLDPPVQVILDVGAQIIELDNLGVAQRWLQLSDDRKEAVVFVNDFDELSVIDRKGRIDPLKSSPFVSRLDVCLVFLDESHTRGIDLKLPDNYRAAVTLGAHLTKDRLMQACMRMRKLGKGQSVVFCISREIQTKIKETVADDRDKSTITVADVLLWSISETHAETRRCMPLWTVQGERFLRQDKIWNRMKEDGATVLSRSGAEELLEEEAQSIEHRYQPRKTESHPALLAKAPDEDLRRIAGRCQDFDGLHFNASTLQEEQERELSPEIEQERQRQKRAAASPALHCLHKDVVKFALSGELISNSTAYMPAFESLATTSAASLVSLSQLGGDGRLLATVEFATTIMKAGKSVDTDMFQRPVQWVLTRCKKEVREIDLIMLISPYEADLLLPTLTSPIITLHLYKPRCNAGFSPLDNMDLFTVSAAVGYGQLVLPRPLSVQLGLFAGQLYISSYEDYLEISKFLGFSTKLMSKKMEDEGWDIGTDGFILRDGKGRVGGSSGLEKSPANFLKVLLSKIRRNGDSISKTDMGRFLEGQVFQKLYWQQ